ncbi:hypothetical protein [Desulfovibrio sp. JC010]|uniref:hypothetical protein n=1 Tax=Desulfovibrio sp. JC010 TaxID=2593641 RepID=UPI0013D7B9BA|nr:hypothetical protein [Desulfovibrio sp. JC010]NDV25391.1 hypothetical protein [Desulfovibrio sp. JC010]
MLKNSGLVKLFCCFLLIFISGCAGHETKPAVPMTVFNPTPGSFNVQVILFDLKGNGMPHKVEAGVVPMEQNIIQALDGIGYHYAPNGAANYLIEARIGSISPKLAAAGASQHVGFAYEGFYGDPFFREYPVLINEWTPEIQRIRSGPNTCFITMQVLIKESKAGRDTVVYHGTPRPMEVPYELGCPYAKCGQGATQALTSYLLELFSRSARK